MVEIVGIDSILTGITEYVDQAQGDLLDALTAHATEVAAEMRGRAPWHDVTGEARNYLNCDAQPVGTGRFASANAGLAVAVSGVSEGINFVLHGDSDHNAILETERGGALAIITPTFYQEQVTVVDIARKALDK